MLENKELGGGVNKAEEREEEEGGKEKKTGEEKTGEKTKLETGEQSLVPTPNRQN